MTAMKKISLEEPTTPTDNSDQLITKELEPNMTSLEVTPVSKPGKKNTTRILFVSLAIVAGLLSGFFLSQAKLKQAGLPTVGEGGMTQNPADASSVKVGDVFGSKDQESFRDSATGIIQPGGIDGEGSHHLERGNDESQWVYLTSSVVDLDLFLTTEVELWGETFQGKKAGWLMDVGRLKVLKLNAAEINNIELAE